MPTAAIHASCCPLQQRVPCGGSQDHQECREVSRGRQTGDQRTREDQRKGPKLRKVSLWFR